MLPVVWSTIQIKVLTHGRIFTEPRPQAKPKNQPHQAEMEYPKSALYVQATGLLHHYVQACLATSYLFSYPLPKV